MLKILHFNDVYDIEARADHTAGAARFVTAMEQHGLQLKLVLFSGDLFGAS